MIFKESKGISEINNSGNTNAVNAIINGSNTHGYDGSKGVEF